MFQIYDGDKLHRACIDGSYRDIERCLLSGENPNKHNENGLTPLHLITQRQELEDAEVLVDILVSHGGDINCVTALEHYTPLHLVVLYANQERAENLALKLLHYGADKTKRDRKRMLPYDYAIANRCEGLATILSGIPPSQDLLTIKRLKNVRYWTRILQDAINKGNSHRVAETLANGADVNFPCEHGASFVHYTIRYQPVNKLAILGHLLNNAPDLTMITEDGSGALHYTITFWSHDHIQALDMLLSSRADPNLKDKNGDTPLNLAIKLSNLRHNDDMFRIADKLLEWGADKTIEDMAGKTAWTLAYERNYQDIKALLRDLQQELFDNILFSDADSVKAVLVYPEVDPNMPNQEEHHPVHLAVLRKEQSDKVAIFKLLQEAGADLNIQCAKKQQTALHLAAEQNDMVATKALLDLGVLTHITAQDQKTAYQLAKKLNHKEVAKAIDDYIKSLKKNSSCVLL